MNEQERIEFLCALFGFESSNYTELELWGMIAREFYQYQAKANNSSLAVAPSSGNDIWIAKNNTDYVYDKGPICK